MRYCDASVWCRLRIHSLPPLRQHTGPSQHRVNNPLWEFSYVAFCLSIGPLSYLLQPAVSVSPTRRQTGAEWDTFGINEFGGRRGGTARGHMTTLDREGIPAAQTKPLAKRIANSFHSLGAREWLEESPRPRARPSATTTAKAGSPSQCRVRDGPEPRAELSFSG